MFELESYEGLAWRVGFAYEDCGTPISFELVLPQRDWRYRSRMIGGHDESVARVQESFVIRHDREYDLRLRFTEEEWVQDLEPMLMVLWQQAQDFTVQLDVADETTEHLVQLVAPWDEVSPTPHEFFGLLELTLTVRTVGGEIFSYPFFDLDTASS